MSVQYGLTITNQNAINEKAKTKKDGCYTFRGVAYRVRSGAVTHFSVGGEVLQQFGAFNTVVARLERYSQEAALKFLRTIK